jgi:outer membrane receptor protein involved in Fe transport
LVVLGEWFARRGVRAFEQLESCEALVDNNGLPAPTACTTTGEAATLNRGELDELAAAGTLARQFGAVAAQVGLRGAWERQDDRGREQTSNSAVVGFLGATASLGRGFEVSAHVGSGTRLPGLSERLYSGVTGAGRIVGNPDLKPERSRNYELGVRHLGQRGLLALHLFRTDVQDFIERVEVEDDLFTYRNLIEGTIEGGEVEANFRFAGGWRLDASGQYLRGTDQDRETLADIPADRTRLTFGRTSGRWDWQAEWVHRFAKDHFGSGEAAVDAANLVAGAVTIELRPGLGLTASGRNLLDELWTPSADRRAAPGPGRSFALQVRWTAR